MQTALGKKLSTFHGSFWGYVVYWYLGGACVLAALKAAYDAVISTATPDAGLGSALVQVAVSGSVGGILLMVAYVRWRQRLTLYEHGLVWVRLWGTREVRRESVADVRLGTSWINAESHKKIWLYFRDGRRLCIQGFTRGAELQPQLVGWLAPPVVPSTHGWVLPTQSSGAPAENAPSTAFRWQPPDRPSDVSAARKYDNIGD